MIRLVELWSENKYILLITLSPLLVHFTFKILYIQNIFDLNDYLITRDIYLLILSIYLGYLFLELIRILRLPVLRWEVIQDGTQVLLKLEPYKDFFNRQLGISILDKVSNKITMKDEIYIGKWQSMPEPLIPVVLSEALYDGIKQSIDYIPNNTLIPGNRYSYIKYGENEHLILFWLKDSKLYKIDEYRYQIKLRFEDDLKTTLPKSMEIELDNRSDKYLIRFELCECFTK